jgi:hypothetical protein
MESPRTRHAATRRASSMRLTILLGAVSKSPRLFLQQALFLKYFYS